MGGSRWKLSLEDIGLDTSKPWGYRKSVFPHRFYRVRWWFPVLGKLNAVTTMKEFTILQGNKKDVIQRNRGIFEVNLPPFYVCPRFFFGGSFHLFLAVYSLRSSLRPPPCRTSVAKRQRESGAQGLGSFSWRDGWITRNPWVWSPLMEIFSVKNTDFRDQTKELLE